MKALFAIPKIISLSFFSTNIGCLMRDHNCVCSEDDLWTHLDGAKGVFYLEIRSCPIFLKADMVDINKAAC